MLDPTGSVCSLKHAVCEVLYPGEEAMWFGPSLNHLSERKRKMRAMTELKVVQNVHMTKSNLSLLHFPVSPPFSPYPHVPCFASPFSLPSPPPLPFLSSVGWAGKTNVQV